MFVLDPQTDVAQFKELPMAMQIPTRMPCAKVVVWVDRWGHGFRPPEIYLLDSQHGALENLRGFWSDTYVMPWITNMRWFDPGNAELKIIS